MIPYLILISIPVIFSFIAPDKNTLQKLLLFFTGIIYIFFIGFRDEVGADWVPYLYMYDYMSESSLPEALEFTEPAYALLNWLLAQVDIGISGVYFIVSIIFVSGLIRFANKMPNPWLALVAVTPYLVIAIGLSAARQAAAIGFVFHLIAGWGKSSDAKNIFLALIATTFHYSAFISFLFVAQSMKMPKWTRWVILILGGIVSLFIFSKTEKYLSYETVYLVQNLYSPGALQHIALNAIPAIIYLSFIKKWQVIYGKSDLLLILAFSSLLSVVGVFISSTGVDRLALYLSPIQMLIYSSIPVVFKNQIYSIAIIIIHLGILYVWLAYANTAFAFLPYKNILLN